MSLKYMRAKDGTVTSTTDLIAWAKWYEVNSPTDEAGWLDSPRRVANDVVGEATVSTVFLSLDHNFSGIGPPILWETMIFGGPHDNYQERYASEDAAKEHHQEIVNRLKNGEPLE